MEEIKEISSILKRVLVCAVEWSLFFVSLVLCLVGGIAAGGLATNNEMSPNLANFHPLYEGASFVSFAWIVFVSSFLCSAFFSIFIFTKGLNRTIFSLGTPSLIVLVMLGYVHWRSMEYTHEEKIYYIKCALGENPGHYAQCESMSEQERGKMMQDHSITEKDLETYRRKYSEK